MTSPSGPARWGALRTAFDELVELDRAARDDRLATIGSSDPDARQFLEELLAADADAEARLASVERILGTAGRAAAHDPDLIGQTIGHFRILGALASGGMGVVYRAEDTRLGRQVALKFPLPDHRLDGQVRERFLQEARAGGALDHPNLCSIYEAGETEDGHLFIAMPLYDGETLRERIARVGALPVRDALSIATQVAHGLGAAHRAGIIHRDLKPANLMLLADGGLKILDFGLARVSDATMTNARATLGTVSYMAPEQVLGQPLDGRTDLWALGVLLYEMLTGRRPFEGDHEITVAHAIVHARPARPSTLRPELDASVDGLVLRLLSKKSADRYASADAVAEELAAVRQPAAARRRMPRLRASFTRRRLGGAALLAIVLPAAGVGAWLLRPGDASGSVNPHIVAVLPFDGIDDPDGDDHLAIGLGDAVTTQLSQLHAVAVPGLPPADAYGGTSRPLSDIAQELEAAAVVRGSIRRSGDTVRLDIELFDARRGRSHRTRSYEAAITDVVTLQRAATEGIASALRLDITSAERLVLRRPPTSNAEAYDLYLQGRTAQLRDPRPATDGGPVESLQRAQSLYALARELDPDFALARARLAFVHVLIATRYDRTQARRDQIRLEADAALRSQPGLAEAHQALAAYWDLEGDPVKAVEELERALASSPNRSNLRLNLGVRLRSLGRWEEAITEIEQATALDPRNSAAHTQAAMTYSRLRRYDQAVRHWDRVIALGAPNPTWQLIRGHVLLRQGNVDSLEAALARIPADWDDGGMATFARYVVLRIQRRHDDALTMLDGAPHAISRDGLVYRPVTLMRAHILEDVGDIAGARSNFERARGTLEDSVAAHPREGTIRVALGLAYAGLSRHVDAAREARAAMELTPLSADNPTATAVMGVAAEVFARAGEADAALQLLELLLAIPAGREVSVPLLRIDPAFDPLRTDPRFDRLMERFSRS